MLSITETPLLSTLGMKAVYDHMETEVEIDNIKVRFEVSAHGHVDSEGNLEMEPLISLKMAFSIGGSSFAASVSDGKIIGLSKRDKLGRMIGVSKPEETMPFVKRLVEFSHTAEFKEALIISEREKTFNRIKELEEQILSFRDRIVQLDNDPFKYIGKI